MLLRRYDQELDWDYLKGQAKRPDNDILSELLNLKKRIDDDKKGQKI